MTNDTNDIDDLTTSDTALNVDATEVETEEIRIDDRYVLHERLGEGGMGSVYRATHVLMDKPVAVKLIHQELAQIPEVVKRFEREAKSASRLTNPHCITVTDFGRTDDGMLYLVMELLSGQDLQSRLETMKFFSVGKTFAIIKQILKGLIHAHKAGVVHRDLKPENVMLVSHGDQTDFVKVFDFGIAKLASGAGSADNLTQAGLIVGTPAYISPEQALGEAADHRADIYAVGIMLYEMLTGLKPYDGETAIDIVSAHLTTPIPKLPSEKKFPAGLQGVLNKAMAKKPAERFGTASEFFEAIESVETDESSPTKTLMMAASVATKTVKPGLLGISKSIGAGLVFVRDYVNSLPPKYRRLVKSFSALFCFVFLIVILVSIFGKDDTFEEEVKVEVVTAPGLDEQKIQKLLERAEAELKSGLHAEAITTLRRTLKLSPDQPIGHLLMGHARFLAEDRDTAMNSYERALGIDDTLSQDARLGSHLEEGLNWKASREKAAQLLAKYGGEKGIDVLAKKANSQISSGEQREVARKVLITAEKTDKIDWLASLSADFNDFKTCKKRKKIISQMEQTGNPNFLPLLEAQRTSEKKKGRGFLGKLRRSSRNSESDKLKKCLVDDVGRAIKTLTEIRDGTSKKP